MSVGGPEGRGVDSKSEVNQSNTPLLVEMDGEAYELRLGEGGGNKQATLGPGDDRNGYRRTTFMDRDRLRKQPRRGELRFVECSYGE